MHLGGDKIFCIGFNKTGTTSLHRFFVSSGLSSVHNTVWPGHATSRLGRLYFRRHQCFSDGEAADFTALSAAFPKALFVLNTRGDRAWIRSRIKHVINRSAEISEGRKDGGGEMFQEMRVGPEAAIRKWLAVKPLYEARARMFFEGSGRFVEISVTDDADWQERLAAFLEANGVRLREAGAVEPQNTRTEAEVADAPRLARCYDIADRLLAEAPAAGT